MNPRATRPAPTNETPASRARPIIQPASVLALSTALSTIAAAPALQAQTSPPAPTITTVATSPRRLEVRLGMSAAATDRFAETRFRRLLAIEVRDFAFVSPSPLGPIRDEVAYVWIDVPSPSFALIEMRLGPNALSRRSISMSGLGRDVSGRLVALAVSEMLRAQTSLSRVRKPQSAKPVPNDVVLVPARRGPVVALTGSAAAAVLPWSETWLAGSGLGLSFSLDHVGQRIFGRWLGGDAPFGPLGWLELGLGADARYNVGRGFRVSIGAEASAAMLHFGAVRGVNHHPGDRDTWSARAGLDLGLETKVGRSTWLAVGLSPGAILRPVPWQSTTSHAGSLKGGWFGLSVSLLLEHPSSLRASPNATRGQARWLGTN